MMKFTGALSTGLAVLFVLPSAGEDDYRAATLREALARTVSALESLSGIETDLQAGKREAVAQILAWTEPPAADPRELDHSLVDQREEVSRIREQIDQLEQRAVATPTPEHSPAPTPAPAQNLPMTGLDPHVLRVVQEVPLPRTSAAPAPAVPEADAVRVDPPNYSADVLGEVQAAYRAKRYSEGLALLAEPGTDAESWYWRGRLLEKLESHLDAAEAYRRVIELLPGSHQADRAAESLKFLEWRLDFKRRVGTALETGGQR